MMGTDYELGKSLCDLIVDVECCFIQVVLSEYDGHVINVVNVLGLECFYLYKKMKALGFW